MNALAIDYPLPPTAPARSPINSLGWLGATFVGVATALLTPVAASPQTVRLGTAAQGTVLAFPRPRAVTWDNPALAPNAALMNTPTVQQFLQLVPSANDRAVQRIYALAMRRFGNWPSLETVISLEMEEDGPSLFVSLDTHGMNFDEQMRLELAMNEDIHQDPELTSTRRRIVLTVI